VRAGDAAVITVRRERTTHFAFGVVLSAIILCGSAVAQAPLPKLSDLSPERRADLFTQIDAIGLITAMFNYCQHPPNVVGRLTPVLKGCIDAGSLDTVLDRLTSAVVENSGAYNCRGASWEQKWPEIERKIDVLVSSVKTACQRRSLYKISFPKFNFP
jgi:hypothetical protein